MFPLKTLKQYCDFGWKLVPTWGVISLNGALQCECEGGPHCRKPGKHPRINAWQRQATCDWNVIYGWSQQWPNANWGWLQNRTFAIDVDAHRMGIESLTEWESVSGGPSPTLTQYTPNGGLHLIYRQPSIQLGSLKDFMPGIEIRGVGSYIMIAPAQGIAGCWRWKTTSSPDLIQECDKETYTIITSNTRTIFRENTGTTLTTNRTSLPSTEVFFVRGFGFHTGSRNQDAYRLMWRFLAQRELRPLDISLEDIVRALFQIWRVTPQGNDPFSWEECLGCFKSAYERRKRQSDEEQAKNSLLVSHIRA